MKDFTKIVGVGLVAIAMPFAALAASTDSQNLDLTVTGLSSQSVQMKVQSALASMKGVQVKQIDATTGLVHVTIDAEETSADTVVTALRSAGFEAKVLNMTQAPKKEY